MNEHDRKIHNEALEMASGFLIQQGYKDAAIRVLMLRIGEVTEQDKEWATLCIKEIHARESVQHLDEEHAGITIYHG